MIVLMNLQLIPRAKESEFSTKRKMIAVFKMLMLSLHSSRRKKIAK